MAIAMNKNTICLWYKDDAEGAARFYAERVRKEEVQIFRSTPRFAIWSKRTFAFKSEISPILHEWYPSPFLNES